MDNSGNMLVGYTRTSSTLFPEIDVAGRLASYSPRRPRHSDSDGRPAPVSRSPPATVVDYSTDDRRSVRRSGTFSPASEYLPGEVKSVEDADRDAPVIELHRAPAGRDEYCHRLCYWRA